MRTEKNNCHIDSFHGISYYILSFNGVGLSSSDTTIEKTSLFTFRELETNTLAAEVAPVPPTTSESPDNKWSKFLRQNAKMKPLRRLAGRQPQPGKDPIQSPRVVEIEKHPNEEEPNTRRTKRKSQSRKPRRPSLGFKNARTSKIQFAELTP
ncbi:hypothetical protein ABEW05_010450 [Botrytis cinerea]